MNISDMKELDQWAVDEITKAFGRINCNCLCHCLDFGGEIECTYSPMEDKWQVRREVHGEEEMAKKEYYKMYKNPAKIPNCTGIIQRDRATIVSWDDGTETTIVAEKGFDENEHMMFDAFCIAFTKKMLGSTTNILKTIEKNDTDKQNQLQGSGETPEAERSCSKKEIYSSREEFYEMVT